MLNREGRNKAKIIKTCRQRKKRGRGVKNSANFCKQTQRLLTGSRRAKIYLFILLDRFEENKVIYREDIKELSLEVSENDATEYLCKQEEKALSEHMPQLKLLEKRSIVIIIVIILLLTGMQVIIDQMFSFTPEKWKEHKSLRKYMLEELMRRSDSFTGDLSYKYKQGKSE